MSAGWPYRCTAMMPAAPRARSSRSTASTERVRVTGSQSTSTGSAPTRLTASAVATNVFAGTITRSPQQVPSARSARTSASVPDETATQLRTSDAAAANSSSNATTSGPFTNAPARRTRLQASRISPCSPACCSARANSGTSNSVAVAVIRVPAPLVPLSRLGEQRGIWERFGHLSRRRACVDGLKAVPGRQPGAVVKRVDRAASGPCTSGDFGWLKAAKGAQQQDFALALVELAEHQTQRLGAPGSGIVEWGFLVDLGAREALALPAHVVDRSVPRYAQGPRRERPARRVVLAQSREDLEEHLLRHVFGVPSIPDDRAHVAPYAWGRARVYLAERRSVATRASRDQIRIYIGLRSATVGLGTAGVG